MELPVRMRMMRTSDLTKLTHAAPADNYLTESRSHLSKFNVGSVLLNPHYSILTKFRIIPQIATALLDYFNRRALTSGPMM